MTRKLLLSFDVESPRHATQGQVTIDKPVTRLGIQHVRDLLSRYNAEATFFIVSDLLNEIPGELRRVHAAGHEIASHTADHSILTRPNTDIRHQVSVSKHRLETFFDVTVTGFRAPVFSVSPTVLQEIAATYTYDSSIVHSRPIPGWYGTRVFPETVFSLADYGFPSCQEAPVSSHPVTGFPLSPSWTRLLGVSHTINGIKHCWRNDVTPVLVYHPWEFVEWPARLPLRKRFHTAYLRYRTGQYMRNALEKILSLDADIIPIQAYMTG